MIVGNSGRCYIPNPMGLDRYGYTTYASSDLSLASWLGSTPVEVAHQDATEIAPSMERWIISSPEGKVEIECDELGDYADTNITITIEKLVKAHGFHLVHAECITTN